MSCVMYHIAHVMCHKLRVNCHLSPVTCYQPTVLLTPPLSTLGWFAKTSPPQKKLKYKKISKGQQNKTKNCRSMQILGLPSLTKSLESTRKQASKRGHTLFFIHRSQDLTMSDLSKPKPPVSTNKPMGQLWAASSSVFEVQSLTNSGNFIGFV